ncbi:MAG: AAA family ATPase, partial [Desulfobulbaceae bacterium]|nr:AAA family ATPase [Desulfobulbaceae bacterium]
MTEPVTTPSGAEIFLSQAVRDACEKLSHNIRIGVGLQLVIGDDGSGKTTLFNQLAQRFSADNNTVVLLLNNPQFRDLQQFLVTVAAVFKTIKTPSDFDDSLLQRAFNSFFYKLCLQEKKTVLLLIDNGQNLPDFCLNALNSFYDHHMDCRSLLQVVICCEPSLVRKINANDSLNSRVAFAAVLKPLGFKDTRKFILFHLERTTADHSFPPALFSIPAQWAIYHMTQGHPKEIIELYHFIVLTLAIENRKKVGWFMTLRCAKQLIPPRAKKLQIIQASSLASLVVLILLLGLWSVQTKTLSVPQPEYLPEVTTPQRIPPPEQQPLESVKVPQKILSPAILTEGQVEVAAPAENSAAFPVQPEDKAASVQVPVLESATVTPAIKESRQVMLGDTFLGMIQQVYGPDYVNT